MHYLFKIAITERNRNSKKKLIVDNMALNPPAGFVWELDLTYSEDNPKVILREKDLLVHIVSEHDLCDFKKKV